MAIFKPVDYEDLFTLSPHSLHPFIEVFLPPHPNIDEELEEINIEKLFPTSFTSLYKFHSITKGKPFREQIPQGYHDPSQLKENFLEIEITNPSFAKLIDITSLFSLPSTVDGNSILALKLSDNVEEDEDEENVLIVCNHHARELITPEIALSTAQLLSSSYGNNETITNLINEKQIYIIWTLNPDGLNYVWNFDNMWRKNRRDNGDGSYGVDLNRNYDFGWSFSCGGSTIKYTETYRGPFPSSEIEVQTMMTFQFDRSFSNVLDYHSYAMEVRPNYAECAYLPANIDSTFKEYASYLAQSTERYSLGQSCCTGGNIGNSYYYFGSLSNLIESGTSFQPPSEVMKKEVEDVWPMTFSFLTLPTPLFGHVFDTNNKPLPSAFFSIPQITWEYGEVWSTSKKGRYALWLPLGEWNVEVYKTGYQNQTISVSISSLSSSVELDFHLAIV